jgi:hypothetical protein
MRSGMQCHRKCNVWRWKERGGDEKGGKLGKKREAEEPE